jgi:hypothetical protein
VLQKTLLAHCFLVHIQTSRAQKISAVPVGVGISIRAKKRVDCAAQWIT